MEGYYENLEQKLHRTWVEALVEFNLSSLASVAIDTQLMIATEEYNEGFNSWVSVPRAIILDIPISTYAFIKKNEEAVKRTVRGVCQGHISDSNGRKIDVSELDIEFRVALLEVEEGWQNIIRRLIADSRHPNQALITAKAFEKRGQQPLVYNEMRFATKAEIRIAQELETRNVLFFPLPLAVRYETGNFYNDHREVDFLICNDGVFGILEVSHHTNRYEQDKEKDAWFKKSGILCVEHYTTERCLDAPDKVVDEFLGVLAKHKR